MLDQPRLPGSSRFMAPEEFQPGSLIDQTTNVFTLGRTAFELLSDGSTKRSAWRGTDPQFAVALRATRPKPAERYPTVAAFVAAWRAGADQ